MFTRRPKLAATRTPEQETALLFSALNGARHDRVLLRHLLTFWGANGPRVAWTPPRADVLRIATTLRDLTLSTAVVRTSASLGLPVWNGYTGFGVMNPDADRPAPTIEDEPLFAPRPEVGDLWRVHRGTFQLPTPKGMVGWYTWPDADRTFERYLATLALSSGALSEWHVGLLVADGALPRADGSFRDPLTRSRWTKLRDRMAW